MGDESNHVRKSQKSKCGNRIATYLAARRNLFFPLGPVA